MSHCFKTDCLDEGQDKMKKNRCDPSDTLERYEAEEVILQHGMYHALNIHPNMKAKFVTLMSDHPEKIAFLIKLIYNTQTKVADTIIETWIEEMTK